MHAIRGLPKSLAVSLMTLSKERSLFMIKNISLISMLAISFLFPTTVFCKDSLHKNYDRSAKTMYSENDVKAFVYNWFAGFDH